VTTLGIQRTIDGVLTSADSATLTVTDETGQVIVSPVVVPPASTGVYSYDASYMAPGTYNAAWTFHVGTEFDQTLQRIFTIDPPTSVFRGVTMADIERGIARRVGPFWKYVVSAGDSTFVVINRLRTSIDIGDYEELYILRRGRMTDKSLITNFDDDDRIRLISAYTPQFGSLEPGRSWTVTPLENEEIEIHYLEPDQELREIARQGLSRCYFWDTGLVENLTTTTNREINISNAIPWITRDTQIHNVEWGQAGQMASRLGWWQPVQRGADVWLRVAGLPLGSLQISALRPHSTYVNGEMSFQGPDDDDDVLHVDLEYATRAGHIMAWAMVPDRLTPVAAEGLRLPMKMAADAFTQASYAYVKHHPELLQLTWNPAMMDLVQIGNAAEPNV